MGANLGLSAAEERLLEKALASHNMVHIAMSLLTSDGDVVARLDDDVLTGQVNCNVDAASTRYLTADILTRKSLAFEADGDWSGALNFNREIQVVYGVKAPGRDIIEVPVHTGPVVDFDRSADMMTVESAGREWYAQGNFERPFTIPKGTDYIDAIKRVLRECGERRFDFPDLRGKLPRDESFNRLSVPWEAGQKFADALDRQLYYTGEGIPRLRTWPKNASIVFRDGDGGLMATPPTISPNLDGFANRVIVKGADQKQSKQRDGAAADPNRKQKPDPVGYIATAERSHPSSPWNMGRLVDGVRVPRFVDHVIDNPHIRTNARAKQVADRLLAAHLAQTVEARFDGFPCPHLDVGDWYGYASRDGAGRGRLREFSLPLTAGELMPVNYRKRRSSGGARRGRGVLLPRARGVLL